MATVECMWIAYVSVNLLQVNGTQYLIQQQIVAFIIIFHDLSFILFVTSLWPTEGDLVTRKWTSEMTQYWPNCGSLRCWPLASSPTGAYSFQFAWTHQRWRYVVPGTVSVYHCTCCYWELLLLQSLVVSLAAVWAWLPPRLVRQADRFVWRASSGRFYQGKSFILYLNVLKG